MTCPARGVTRLNFEDRKALRWASKSLHSIAVAGLSRRRRARGGAGRRARVAVSNAANHVISHSRSAFQSSELVRLRRRRGTFTSATGHWTVPTVSGSGNVLQLPVGGHRRLQQLQPDPDRHRGRRRQRARPVRRVVGDPAGRRDRDHRTSRCTPATRSPARVSQEQRYELAHHADRQHHGRVVQREQDLPGLRLVRRVDRGGHRGRRLDRHAAEVLHVQLHELDGQRRQPEPECRRRRSCSCRTARRTRRRPIRPAATPSRWPTPVPDPRSGR